MTRIISPPTEGIVQVAGVGVGIYTPRPVGLTEGVILNELDPAEEGCIA